LHGRQFGRALCRYGWVEHIEHQGRVDAAEVCMADKAVCVALHSRHVEVQWRMYIYACAVGGWETAAHRGNR
jgi:hypothetical protein